MFSDSSRNKRGNVNKLFLAGQWLWSRCYRAFFKPVLCLWKNPINIAFKKNPFARESVTLSIEDDGMHLAVFRGTDVEKWGSFPLTSEVIKDGVIVNPVELGNLIDTFLKQQCANNQRIICSVSGFHSLSRIITLPKLSSSTIYEAVGREAARAMPTATDASHIFWHILNQTRSYQRFYILATPKDNVDRIARAIKKKGTIGGKIELKPLALARLVKKPQAIIIDVQNHSVDVVIVVQGVPVYFRVLNRDEQTSILTIAGEIARTIEYFNRNNTQQPIKVDTPLFLTGSLSINCTEIKQFVTLLNYPLAALDVLPKYPTEFPLEKYATNVGLFLGVITNKKAIPFRWVSINLLSAIYRPHRTRLKLSIASAAAIFGILSIFPLYNMSARVAVAKDQVQAEWYKINQEIVLKRLAKKEAVRFESNIKDIEAQAEKLEMAQQTIMGQGARFAVPLAIVYDALPPGISINSAITSNHLMKLVGKADNYETMVKFIAVLEGKGLFSGIRINNIVRLNPQASEISFNLELKEK